MVANEQLVEEILGIFDALDTSGGEEGVWGSQRDMVEFDLGRLEPEELVDQLWAARKVIEGYVVAAEGVNMVTLAVLSDCRNRVQEAYERACKAAGLDL